MSPPNPQSENVDREASDESVDFLRSLTDAGRAVTGSLDIDDVLQKVLESVSALLKPKTWALLLAEDDQTLKIEQAVGEYADRLRGQRIPIGSGVAGWVAEHRTATFVSEVGADPRFGHLSAGDSVLDRAAFQRFLKSSVLAVPLVYDKQLLGVIELIRLDPDQGPFSHTELNMLSPFADFAAIAINNAANYRRVEELTIVDEWTGLYNARYLRRLMREEITRAVKYRRDFAIIFFDLDGFKAVNDHHGHSVGSNLLRSVAELAAGQVRETDRVIRYGGDEYVIALPETDCASAVLLAERLCAAIAGTDFGAGVSVSASFGVADVVGCGVRGANAGQILLDAADRAMYASKRAGKNRVTVADPTAVAEVASGQTSG